MGLEAGGPRYALASAQTGAARAGGAATGPSGSKGRDRAHRTRESQAKRQNLSVKGDPESHPLGTSSDVRLLTKPPLPLLKYLQGQGARSFLRPHVTCPFLLISPLPLSVLASQSQACPVSLKTAPLAGLQLPL